MSELEKGCHRSHPHEEMDEICRLKAELAKVAAERDRLKAEVVKWQRIRTPTHGTCCTCQRCGLDYDSCRCYLDDVCDEVDKLKAQLATAKAEGVRVNEWLRDELWSFLRNVLSQGGCIQLDYANKSYEEYAIHLDEAARERADQVKEIVMTDDLMNRILQRGAFVTRAHNLSKFEQGLVKESYLAGVREVVTFLTKRADDIYCQSLQYCRNHCLGLQLMHKFTPEQQQTKLKEIEHSEQLMGGHKHIYKALRDGGFLQHLTNAGQEKEG